MNISVLVTVSFWLAAFGMLHAFALYPAFLYAVSFFLPGPPTRSLAESDLPTVALVIAAYNEEEVIAEKIENSLELDYPSEKLRIVVFSDESADRTDEIVESYAPEGVVLRRIVGRVGKTECQNRVVADLDVDVDVVVFSDADSMYTPDAIRELVAKFGPGVGCVVGELRYRMDDSVESESVYRRYERLIKRLEPMVHSVVGGNGSIYAVRRESYNPLPTWAISDFAEPLSIVLGGERVAYAKEAEAWESAGQTVEDEVQRRIRIVTRSWHSLADYSALFNPLRYGSFSFLLVSHTFVRWLSPVFLVAAFVSNAALVALSVHPVYEALFALQLLFYAGVAVGALLDRTGRGVPAALQVPYYFTMLNYSLVVGLWNFLSGRNIVTWETAARQ